MRIFHCLEIDRRRYSSRSDTNDKDIVLCQFETSSAGQHPHPSLRKTICDVAWHRPIFMHGCDIDDTSSTTLFNHLFCGDLRTKKSTLKIYIEYFFILSFRRIENRGAGFYTGIVNHDIEPSKVLAGRID